MSFITIPFSWLLLTLYNFVNNYGIAIILFAVVVKVILLPFQMKSKRSMMRMSSLAPRLKEMEKRHGTNRQAYQQEASRLYKEENIKPMSGCLWTIIPFPILIALYSVIRQPLTKLMNLTAEQVSLITDKLVSMGLYEIPEKLGSYYEITLADIIHNNFETIKGIVPQVIDLDFSFLGLNLGDTPQWNFFLHVDWSNSSEWLPALGLFLIPFLSAFFAFLSMKLGQNMNPVASPTEQQKSMKTMMYTMPLVSVWICFVMPAALGIYWIAQGAFGFIQELVLNKHYRKKMEEENAERRERDRLRDEELERKRLETEKLRAEGATERNPNTSKKKIQATQKAREDERQAAEKAADRAARRARLGIEDTQKPDSQIGNRRYARGRAYVDDRFTSPEWADEATRLAAAESEYGESIDDLEQSDLPEIAAIADASVADLEEELKADELSDNAEESEYEPEEEIYDEDKEDIDDLR